MKVLIDGSRPYWQSIEAKRLERLLEQERVDFLAAAKEAGFECFILHDEMFFDIPEERYVEFMELAMKYMGKVDDA